jgi:hypothetical protein
MKIAAIFAIGSMLVAALLLGFGGWQPVLCLPFHVGYPLCAL